LAQGYHDLMSSIESIPGAAATGVCSGSGLAQRLREGTWALHGEAERAGIMPALLAGRLAPAVFHVLQRNLHAVYAALEGALTHHAGHAAIAAIHDPRLARSDRLAADLACLHGPAWREELLLMPATLAYVARLHSLEAQDPLGLVAHAYVRYLGDLAGGQMLRRVVARAFGLPAGLGTCFFDFGPPELARTLVQALRAGLTAMPVDEVDVGRMVAEAQWSFSQHMRLFRELEAV
jgi:heme oxygenase